STPFHVADRPSFLGKAPGTLAEIVGKAIEPQRLVDAIVDAYVASWGVAPVDAVPLPSPAEDRQPADDLPGAATVEEAMGVLGAGPDARGAFRVGGDLLVSRDALARLEAAAPQVPEEGLGALVDETLAAPGVALDGVRSLESLRDVIARARA